MIDSLDFQPALDLSLCDLCLSLYSDKKYVRLLSRKLYIYICIIIIIITTLVDVNNYPSNAVYTSLFSYLKYIYTCFE